MSTCLRCVHPVHCVQSYQVLRPLLSLLSLDRTALESFESLLAFTNLTSLGGLARNEDVCTRLVREDGAFGAVEQYMFEEHEMLRRAATECLCNLVLNPHVLHLLTFFFFLQDVTPISLFFLPDVTPTCLFFQRLPSIPNQFSFHFSLFIACPFKCPFHHCMHWRQTAAGKS